MKKIIALILFSLTLFIAFGDTEELLGVYIDHLDMGRRVTDFSWGAADYVPYGCTIIDREDGALYLSNPGGYHNISNIQEDGKMFLLDIPELSIVGKFEMVQSGIIKYLTPRISYSANPETLFHKISGPNLQTDYFVSSGRITANKLRMRDLPNKNGNIIKELPIGLDVIIFMRTKNKMTLGEYSDYWYYLKIGDSTYGWAYGAFIEIEDESLNK